jgi:hypothetical protein
MLGCVPPGDDGADNGDGYTSSTSSFDRGSVIFRLCPPNEACVNNTLDGCANPLGDYVMDTYDFLEVWTYVIETPTRRRCQDIRENQCGPSCSEQEANSADDDAGTFDADFCMFDCYYNSDAYSCYFDFIYDTGWFANATLCAQPTTLEESGYYIGPYCSGGHNFYMGMYTDDECTTFVDDFDKGQGAYRSITGATLNFSEETKESLTLGLPCLTCSSLEVNDDDDGVQLCETIYPEAGKCEADLSINASDATSGSWAGYAKDVIYTDACPYLESIVPQLVTSRSSGGWVDGLGFVLLVLFVICEKLFEMKNIWSPGGDQKEINIPGGDRPLQPVVPQSAHAGPITHVGVDLPFQPSVAQPAHAGPITHVRYGFFT